MTIYNLPFGCWCYYTATVLFHCDPFVDFINIADGVMPTEYAELCKVWY